MSKTRPAGPGNDGEFWKSDEDGTPETGGTGRDRGRRNSRGTPNEVGKDVRRREVSVSVREHYERPNLVQRVDQWNVRKQKEVS